LPGVQKINHITGAASRKIADGEEAFALAPFDSGVKPYFIRPQSQSAMFGGKILTHDKVSSTTKKAFTDYVRSIITQIDSEAYQKIVAARVFATNKPADFNPAILYEKVCKAYPKAFVSMTYIPNVGLWIGASPEVLASQNGTELTTYALAGTKATDDKSPWTDKEKREQEIVTNFIHRKLSRLKATKLSLRGPVTKDTGSLKHLLTVFTLRSKDKNIWQQVTKTLHPTPAVAGMPQEKAIKFIKKNEGFDRRFYAGYLGPVNVKGKTDLYVNLRCMEITDRQLIFYAGCGITAGSNPDREWQESERKIDVLRNLC
jgi:isochorismate synthase